jgi:hypothetical protein
MNLFNNESMMTKRNSNFSIGLAIIATLFIFSSLALPAVKSCLLKYNLSTGTTYKLLIDTRQTINLDMGGQKMAMNQTVSINQSVAVTDKDVAGNTTLDITYDRIQFKQNMMGMDMNWDSDSKVAPADAMSQQLETVFRKTIGAKTTLKMDQYGHAISNNVQDVLKDNSNISGFESGMMAVFPDREIAVGDSWEATYIPDPNGDLTIVSKYTLDELKKDIAMISFESTLKGTQMKGVPAKIEGIMSGKSQVDVTTGWILSASISQNLSAETEQQGMTIPMKISSFIDISSK